MFASRFSTLSILGIAAFALALSACDTATDTSQPGIAPALLSSSAFDVDSESFAGTSPLGGQGAPSLTGTNHTRAFLTVALVNLAVGVHLVVPAAATASASQDTPHVEDGTWIWENTMTVFINNVVDVRLEGTPDGSEVDWEMYITSDNLLGQPYDNFVLYTATTQIGGQMGTWSLYYNIEDQGRTRVLDADYVRTGAQHELTFIIPDTNPNQEAQGASVYYMADGNDRVFDFHEPTPNQNHLIEWNAATAAGSITAWNYNNGEKACWDGNLDNVSCTPAAL